MARKTFKKKITSEETLKNINPKNLKLKADFIRFKSTSASKTTLKSYESDLNIFFSWLYLHSENTYFVEIKKYQLIDFFAFAIDELKWSPSRRNRFRSTLSSLSIYIERILDEKYPSFRNIVLKTIDSAKPEPVREKTVLSDEQVDSLLMYLSEKDSQQACWVALAVASGARHSELLRFETEHIDNGEDVFDGIFIETSKRIKTKGRGAGGKMMKKYILKDVFEPYYKVWKKERKEILEKKGIEDHGMLFIKRDGSPASTGTVRSWVRGMSEYLSVPVYPHGFRHRSATALAEKKIPNALIQFLFGWASESMVGVYVDLDAKDRDWDELSNLRH